ncbi:metal-binding protein [Leptospira adleri]|uniref:Metal-binding protein n=2 Tax=Leptospira adleri TaxID=2023186 RepID=A0A2M9YK84_9LEPT|nr:metal-binding protein [Leptospira adleri]PJZ61668.1 metal-binding protein [Leptospira adleri]
MILHIEIDEKKLKKEIRNRNIRFGGNLRLRIYGKLNCSSGKKMKKENRVFFFSKQNAEENGFRPCGHCMKEEYNIWKNQSA